MLLRHTTADEPQRSALTVNPAKTCQPIGAMYAALGIHGCLPHSHGSQGCCSYHRSQLTRHYKEPVMAATSSFTEGSAVFGGQANLLQAIEVIFATYDPEVVAVHTTCLSETIGDDLTQIIAKARSDGKIPAGKEVFHANTPSYQGSHVTGYASMVKAMVTSFATPGPRTGTVALIPGWIEPADMRELKRLSGLMGLATVMAPDTSNVLDAGTLPGGGEGMYPAGGTTLAQLRTLGTCRAALACGPSAAGPAARTLEANCSLPAEVLELPIGLKATDQWIEAMRRLGGTVAAEIAWERSRLVDLLCDMQQYLYGKTVSLWGDPDQLVSLTGFCIDMGMQPLHVVTGTPSKSFAARLEAVIGGRIPPPKVAVGPTADMLRLHQWIKQEKPDLLIGGTHGKYIARDEGIPLIRHGFPILDRIGHQYFPTAGYAGAIRLVEQILNAVMERQDATCPEERFELIM